MAKKAKKKPGVQRNTRKPAVPEGEIQRIIETATIDAYGFDEELWGWLALLQDEMEFPCPVHVLGQPFEVEEPDIKYGRIKFSVYLGGKANWVDATDVMVDDVESRNSVLLAAYRKWLGSGADTEDSNGFL
jgi:hypothetical protein